MIIPTPNTQKPPNMIATSSRAEERKLSATAERFCREFSLAEIHLATGDFSETHLLGMGGFGKVYKGLIDKGQLIVAIKRLETSSNQGANEFLMEIETLSKLRHVNLVSLIGYCSENGEMILVYEYIVHGTLADHLYKLSKNNDSDGCPLLTWIERLKICIGAGRGLDYLHTGCSIIHRDVKSTNILLDENFTAKVSDFGLAKHLSSGNSQGHVSTIVKGSFGYLDPSYFTTCRLTRKSDTYAFGVVLLEVLCGRPAVDPRRAEDEMSLVMWAREKISKGKLDQIVALNLREEISADCLKTFVGVAKRCLHLEPKRRPTMAQAVVQLEFALEQQRREVPTHNASRFPLLDAFWRRGNHATRVPPTKVDVLKEKSIGNHATGSAQKDYNQDDANTLSTVVTPTNEDELKEKPIGNIPFIPYGELKEITENFSSKYLIGRGSNGRVFYGFLKSGQAAAIKELNLKKPSDKEFLAQVTISSSLKHENVVRLLGYFVDGGHQFLAYEIAPNGSLNDILHRQQAVKGSKPGLALSWAQRVKIAVGAARGLKYIHKMGQVHGNIKSSNILVFNDEVAKIADFGEPIQSPIEDIDDLYLDFHPSAFRRPRGHHPPEYVWFGKLSWRTDVYSFGVVLLELLTGRELIDRQRPIEQEHLVMWATPWLGNDAINEIVDTRLNGDYPPKAVEKMAEIAGLCVQDKYESRPNMTTVVRDLVLLPSLTDVPKISCN